MIATRCVHIRVKAPVHQSFFFINIHTTTPNTVFFL